MSSARIHRQLLAAICTRLSPLTIACLGEERVPWESATFSGARHIWHLSVRGEGAWPVAKALAHTASEAEFDLPGVLVADLAVTMLKRRDHQTVELRVEALSVVAS